VNLEEELEQIAIADLTRVKDDLNRFCMRTVIPVGGMVDTTAGITHAGGNDSGQAPNELLHSPKATACEYCAFRFVGHGKLLKCFGSE
jgi:hypothetical protein